MRTVIGNQSEGLAFASGTGSRGNGNQWKHTVFRFSNSPVIRHTAPVSENEIAPLGRIHRTSSSQTDNQVNFRIPRNLGARLHTRVRRIFNGLVEEGHLEPLGFKQFHDSLGMPRRRQSGVRDQQDSSSQ